MSKNKILLSSSAILFITALGLLIWLLFPQPQVERTFLIPEVVFVISEDNGGVSYTLPEGTHAQLRLPGRIWLGSTAEIELIIDPLQVSESIPPEHLEHYNLIAEARIDWPLMVVVPDNTVSQPFGLTHSLVYRWEIKPAHPGRTEGQFWFYFKLVSTQEDAFDRQALLSAPLVVDTISILGMAQGQMRLVLWLILTISALFSIQLFFKSDPGSRK